MAETIGRGVIELVADARKLQAGIETAKKSIRTLGEGQKDISKSASASIDQYVGRLQQQNSAFGKSRRETELFRLAMRGASNEQIKSADAALRVAESNAKNAASMAKFKADVGSLARTLSIALVGGLIAAAASFELLVQKAASFQDLAEKVGDSASSIASLAVAAKIGGIEMDAVGDLAIKLGKNLTGVDDESKAAGAAVKALGLSIEALKSQTPTEQIVTISKAFSEFEDSGQKSAVAMALLGRAGAQSLPFLKELAEGIGQVNILTDEQIERADAYADAHAKSAATIQLHAARIATDLLPTMDDMKGAVLDLVKDLFSLGSESDKLGKNNSIQEFARGVARAFAFVADSIDGVIRAFQIVGKAIAAFAVVMDNVLSFNFSGASSAILQLGEDVDAILNRKFLGTKLEARFEARDIADSQRANFAGPPAPKGGRGKKKLDFEGAQKPGGDQGNLLKAQLDLDLDRIRRAGEEEVAAFSRAQDLMEARRAASLIKDREYFESKLGFINLLASAQDRALTAEIERLKREKFSGKDAAKDQLENGKKIEEAESKLSKVRADAVYAREISSIQEFAANEKVRQSYLDAAEAADAYIDTLRRQAQAELAGIGRGARFREEQAGLAEIQNKFLENRRRLEGELRRGDITSDVFETYLAKASSSYEAEVAIYRARTQSLNAAQEDWVNGANEALSNYLDGVRDIAKQTEDLFTNALSGIESALVDLSTDGAISFQKLGEAAKKIANSITADITRILVKQNITGPLAKAISGGSVLKDFSRLIGGGGRGAPAEQAPAPVVDRSIVATDTLGATISASGAEFSSAVLTASATFSPEIVTAGAQFSSAVVAAGIEFATSVSTAGAVSGGGGGGGFLDGEIASLVLDSFADGVNYVPRTGLYQLHQGERVVPASENSISGGMGSGIQIFQQFAPGTDRRTVSQGAALTGRAVRRELSRGTA